MQHFFVFIALPNNWPIKSKSLPTFVHPFVRHSIPHPPQSLSPLAWPLHARRTFCGHLRAAFVVGPGQQTLLRCCGRPESNCSSLHVLCRFCNSSGVGGRHSHVLRFMLYIFDFAFACKNSIAHFGRSHGNISFLIWPPEVQI